MVKKLACFFLLLGISTVQLDAQTGFSKSFSLDLKSVQSETTKTKYNILFLLANGNPKILSSLKLGYFILPEMHLRRTDYGTAEVFLLIKNMTVVGDTSYRGFPLSQSLLPDTFFGYFKLFQNGRVIIEKEFNLGSVSIGKELKIGYSGIDVNSKVSLEGDINQFQFSDKGFENLENHTGLINDYWACCLLIDSLLTEVKIKNMANSTTAPDLFTYWDKCRKAVLLSKRIVSDKRLNVEKNDPGSLLPLIQQVERMQTRFSTLLDAELQHAGSSNAKYFSQAYLASMTQYRASAQKVGFYDSNIFSEASRIQLDFAFVNKVREISSNPTGSAFSMLMYSGLLEVAKDYFQKDDYASATDVLTDLKHMELNFNEISADPQVSQLLVQSKEAVLNAYLQIASRAMNDHQTELAAKYHRKASQFQKQFNEVSAVQGLNDISGNLVKAYFEQGKKVQADKKWEEALFFYAKALQTSSEFGNITLKESIQKEISEIHRQRYLSIVDQAESLWIDGLTEEAEKLNNRAIYYRENNLDYLEMHTEAVELRRKMMQPGIHSIIGKGMNAAKMGQAREALDAYQKALTMADQFQLVIDAPIDSLAQTAARRQIIETIRSANTKVWSNQLNEALSIVSKAQELQLKYKLESDSSIQDELNRLDQKMIRQACYLHQQDFKKEMAAVNKALNQKRFDLLTEHLDNALEIAKQNQGCRIDQKEALQFQKTYQKLLDYNDKYQQVMTLMYNEGFQLAVMAYDQLDEEVSFFQLGDYGMKHLTVIEFIENQQNSGLSRIAFDYYIGQNSIENALRCYQIAQNQSK